MLILSVIMIEYELSYLLAVSVNTAEDRIMAGLASCYLTSTG